MESVLSLPEWPDSNVKNYLRCFVLYFVITKTQDNSLPKLIRFLKYSMFGLACNFKSQDTRSFMYSSSMCSIGI